MARWMDLNDKVYRAVIVEHLPARQGLPWGDEEASTQTYVRGPYASSAPAKQALSRARRRAAQGWWTFDEEQSRVEVAEITWVKVD